MNPQTMMPNPYNTSFKPPQYMNPQLMAPIPGMPQVFGSDVMPKESLYVNNLNDKIKPEGIFLLFIHNIRIFGIIY